MQARTVGIAGQFLIGIFKPKKVEFKINTNFR